MLKADLHLHSNKSDGILSPKEVVLQQPSLIGCNFLNRP